MLQYLYNMNYSVDIFNAIRYTILYAKVMQHKNIVLRLHTSYNLF